MSKRRNPVANAPILGKGGVHQKSKSALRKQAKRALAKEIRAMYRAQDAPSRDGHRRPVPRALREHCFQTAIDGGFRDHSAYRLQSADV